MKPHQAHKKQIKRIKLAMETTYMANLIFYE